MARCLFLEGPVRIGKSTIIRQCLGSYLNRIGGFSSQRLLGLDEKICGYRLVPAANVQLNASFQCKDERTFMYWDDDVPRKDLTVFETVGTALLSEPCELMLLDEIGGAELLVPAFKDKLYDVLSGDIPCIGVLKLNESAVFMGRSANYSDDIVSANEELRQKLIENSNSALFSFTPESAEYCKEKINEFLKEVFYVETI